jgi:hypothetical protein
MTDRQQGVQAMKWFYDEGIKYNPSLRQVPFLEFVKIIDSKSKSFISGLGLGINMIGGGDAQDSLETLARKSNGKIPNKLSIFTQAVQDGETDFDFSDFVNVSKQTASDLVDYAEQTGKDIQTGISGTATLVRYAKVVVPIVVIGYVMLNLGTITKMVKKVIK